MWAVMSLASDTTPTGPPALSMYIIVSSYPGRRHSESYPQKLNIPSSRHVPPSSTYTTASVKMRPYTILTAMYLLALCAADPFPEFGGGPRVLGEGYEHEPIAVGGGGGQRPPGVGGVGGVVGPIGGGGLGGHKPIGGVGGVGPIGVGGVGGVGPIGGGGLGGHRPIGVGGVGGVGPIGGGGLGGHKPIGVGGVGGVGPIGGGGVVVGKPIGVGGGVGGQVPAAGGTVGLGGKHCKKFCKNDFLNEYECCDHIRPGKCPRVRPHCPPVREFSGPPEICYTDDDCYGEQDKCCPDACLPHRVCKPIAPTYG
ncbi:uncharacterized protein LOC143035938 [Oratosquilla oratoria]|uniref:uncharacterized protein LOC143035938 n=1 Tax=Oratosquilla oratoria TaxID=337810 RepID=UPI003F770824